METSGVAPAWRPGMYETSLESGWLEQMVDNSGLSAENTSVSLVSTMRRSGLGKGLGTLMEPVPIPGKGQDRPEGAVRLFLRTPERPTPGPVEEIPARQPGTVSEINHRASHFGWIPALLFAMDALLVGVAGLLLSLGTPETGKVLILGSIVIGVAAGLGVMGVWLQRRE